MSNEEAKSDLLKYLEQDGAKPISADNPYNDTDAFVLSSISYIEFEGLDKEYLKGNHTIEEYAKKYMEKDAYKTSEQKAKDLVDDIATNPRYKDLKLSNIEAEYSPTEPKQFAAMTVTLPDNGNGTEKVAVFRGTDLKVTSWWEDFTFTFNEGPSCTQERAVEYINKMQDADKIYLTGHSKGGGDDEWAALFCDDDIKSKIVSIISLDGPGIRKDIIEENKEKYDELKKQLGDNWYRIVPEDSLVGYLMSDPENVKVVESSSILVGQHMLNTWKFKDGQLDSGEMNSRETSLFSRFLNNTLDDSLKVIPKPVLQTAVNSTAKIINDYYNHVLDDEIAKHFNEYKDIIDKVDDEDGYFNLLKNAIKADFEIKEKINKDIFNTATTLASDIYTLDVLCEEAIQNIKIAAVEYAAKKIDEGIEYVNDKYVSAREELAVWANNETEYLYNEAQKKISDWATSTEKVIDSEVEKIENNVNNKIQYISNEFESAKEGIASWFNNALSQSSGSRTVYNKIGNGYVEGGAAVYVDPGPTYELVDGGLNQDIDDEDKSESYNSISILNWVCIISGLQLVYYGASYFKDKEIEEVEGEKYVDTISKYIREIMENANQWESVISLPETDKVEETNKFLLSVNDIGVNITQYISNFFGSGSGVLGSSFQQQSVSCASANGEVGLEFAFVPTINNIINQVVDNYNVSTQKELEEITSKLSQLRYTSFSISGQIEACKDSLEKQKQSLYDFRDSLEQYESKVKEMEQQIIEQLGKVQLDCKAV